MTARKGGGRLAFFHLNFWFSVSEAACLEYKFNIPEAYVAPWFAGGMYCYAYYSSRTEEDDDGDDGGGCGGGGGDGDVQEEGSMRSSMTTTMMVMVVMMMRMIL